MQETQAKDTPKHGIKNQTNENTSRAGIPMLLSGNRSLLGHCDASPGGVEVCVVGRSAGGS